MRSHTIFCTDEIANRPAFPSVDDAAWCGAQAVVLNHFQARGSEHRPDTRAWLQADHDALYVAFRVEDRYVRCVHQAFQSPVCEDSCVEFFVQPKSGKGYFNFEFNAGGCLHASYITDPTRVPGGSKSSSFCRGRSPRISAFRHRVRRSWIRRSASPSCGP